MATFRTRVLQRQHLPYQFGSANIWFIQWSGVSDQRLARGENITLLDPVIYRWFFNLRIHTFHLRYQRRSTKTFTRLYMLGVENYYEYNIGSAHYVWCLSLVLNVTSMNKGSGWANGDQARVCRATLSQQASRDAMGDLLKARMLIVQLRAAL